jgi:hypothetical protein
MIRYRKSKNVSLGAWLITSVGTQHAKRQVHGDWSQLGATQIDTKVASASSKVEHECTSRKVKVSHGTFAPPNIETKCHDSIN